MKNYKPILFTFLLILIGAVGATIAYYTSNDTFSNVFNTNNYTMEVKETFESPDDWTPGTETPKEVVATNRGDTVAAVRVKLEESWVDSSGNPIPLKDSNNNPAAIINFSIDKDVRWKKEGDYYYYSFPLDKGESTTSLLQSVTFNPDVQIGTNHNCTTNNVTHETVCTTETTGYGDGTYKLDVTVETCQYDKYKDIWNTNVEIANLIYPTGKNRDTVVVGDIITIGTEQFNVVRRDGDDLILLARYNLNVGENLKPDAPVGIQTKDVVGYKYPMVTYGRVAYSSTNYWHINQSDYPGNYCYSLSDTNCKYVYDENSYVYQYVNDYQRYLESFKVPIKGSRLLSIEEGMTLQNNGYSSFLFYTSFLLGSPFSTYSIGYASTIDNRPGEGFFSGIYHSSVSSYGVRPVIII